METFELRYFSGVAQHQNLHRAAEKLRVSPGSLSKAVSRLEEELGVKLFSREGRGIRLTEAGRLLQRRAAEILSLEENARLELSGSPGTLRVAMTGPEVLLSEMGVKLMSRIQTLHPKASFELQHASDADALRKLGTGEAALALLTSELPQGSPFTSKVLAEVKFQTCVGRGHPLFKAAQAGRVTPVEDVLKHGFVSPSHPLLGRVGERASLDGWRDDRFPRRVDYLCSSLKVMEELVTGGKAIAYLPDYVIARLPSASVLRISGCPYSCAQKVRLAARRPEDSGWMRQLF